MFDRIGTLCAPLLLAMLVILAAGSGANAQDVAWRVSKSSGDASVRNSGGQQAAVTDGAVINPGDNIRTGQNGRVLLKRGEESILISPNSVIGIPMGKQSGLSTTIVQQAGSILLEVEKRNVKHFSVETPYLAAVVKGTQFRVTVNKDDSRVDVLRGQVEVKDFKSGQYAMVLPNQAAQVSALGSAGLSLSGSGALSPIQNGAPGSSSVSLIAGPPSPLPPTASAPAHSAPVVSAPAILSNTRVASAAGGGVSWAPVASDNGSSSYFGWMGKSGKRSTQEDIVLTVGLSAAIGIAVAFVVGAQRRRKSKKMLVKS